MTSTLNHVTPKHQSHVVTRHTTTTTTSSSPPNTMPPPATPPLPWDTVHQYLVLGVVVVGVACCVLTIVVLTRRHVQSPTNTLITSMAGVNVVAMTTVAVFVVCLWKTTDFYTFGR